MEQKGALAGIRVVDFGQVIFGSSCSQVLADHGADVIKVERPKQGDLARAFSPQINGQSLPAISMNRGKRSLAVDIQTPDGRAVVKKLVATADVLVENFRPGVLEKLQLGYGDLSLLNPRLIYAAGSGYGSSGPLAEARRPGHELLAQSLAGLAVLNAVDGIPRALPAPVTDFLGGMLLAQAVLLALVARGRTGEGQYVEVALVDGALALLQWDLAGRLNTPSRQGTANYRSPLQAVYRTRDGFIALVGWFRPNPVANVCAALGLPDLSLDGRYSSAEALDDNGESLREAFQSALSARTTGEWLSILTDHDVLCGPVLAPGDYADNKRARERGSVIEVDQTSVGQLRLVGPPIKLTGTPAVAAVGAPLVGQHTLNVLAELGYSSEQSSDFIERDIVAIPERSPERI